MKHKRWIALLLCAVLIMTSVPVTYAAEEGGQTGTEDPEWADVRGGGGG